MIQKMKKSILHYRTRSFCWITHSVTRLFSWIPTYAYSPDQRCARAHSHIYIHKHALCRKLLSISIDYTLLVYCVFMVLQVTLDLFRCRDIWFSLPCYIYTSLSTFVVHIRLIHLTLVLYVCYFSFQTLCKLNL